MRAKSFSIQHGITNRFRNYFLRSAFRYSALLILFIFFGVQITNAQCTDAGAPVFISDFVYGCYGTEVVLQIEGSNINDAVDWYWYDTATAETLLYVGSSYTFTIYYDQEIFVRGEGGCTNPGPMGSASAYLDGTTYYTDFDSDGYGNAFSSVVSCVPILEGVSFNDLDCDDSNPDINPYGIEVCNGLDDDCDGLTDEGCAPPPANDDWENAQEIPIPFNNYPGCILYEGTVVGATVDVPNYYTTTGEEVWYKFYSNTGGVRIQLLNSQFDGLVELFDEWGGIYDIEDMTFDGENEALNYVGLDTAAWYYVAIRNYDSNLSTGTFSLCLQRLNRSYCAIPGNRDLCSNFKPAWTGANQYVTTFYELPSYNQTSVTSSSQVPLSNPLLDLRHNTSYLTVVGALYNLTDGAGNAQDYVVNGTQQLVVHINNHANVGVKEGQRCEATLFRTSLLHYKPFVCSASDFHLRFTRIDNSNNPIELPFTVVRGSALSTMPLNFVGLPQPLASGGRYLVEVKPIFPWDPSGALSTFGTPQCIKIIGQGLEGSDDLEAELDETYRVASDAVSSIYPNPNLGELLNINIAETEATKSEVRVIDSFGKIVFTKTYSIEGSLNTILTFDQPLAAGLYTIEFRMNDGSVTTERMLVTK